MIKEVNQKFSELSAAEPLSMSFFRKIQSVISPALKDCLVNVHTSREEGKGPMEGVRSLLQYYRWIESNVKNF